MTEPTDVSSASAMPADETTPRDTESVIADFQGEEDPEAELVLQALVAAGQGA